MNNMTQMLVISLMFIVLWILVGIAVALYVRACVEDENMKNSHAM